MKWEWIEFSLNKVRKRTMKLFYWLEERNCKWNYDENLQYQFIIDDSDEEKRNKLKWNRTKNHNAIELMKESGESIISTAIINNIHTLANLWANNHR